METARHASQENVKSDCLTFTGSLKLVGKQVLPSQSTQRCKFSELDMSNEQGLSIKPGSSNVLGSSNEQGSSNKQFLSVERVGRRFGFAREDLDWESA